MEIKGFIGVSLVDWEGKVASVIFLPGCNLRCPFCYNADLVLRPEKLPTLPFDKIKDYFDKHEGWIDGVVITGGEPTIHENLPILCEEIKKQGLPVKVDTNGTNPRMIRKIIDEGLIDYVAMDVKAPLTENAYSKAAGVNAATLLASIEETAGKLCDGQIDYEFRTTLVPTLHETRDIEKICEQIKDCRKYALQNFKTDVETIDPHFQDLKPFSRAEIDAIFETAKRLAPNTVLRC